MIIIEPLGGLANRMRVIASGIWLKNVMKSDLIVVWNVNDELNCPYHLLFETIEHCVVQSKKRKYNYIISSNQHSRKQKVKAFIVNKIIGIDDFLTENDFYTPYFSSILARYTAGKTAHRNIYIQTSQEFGENLFAFQYFIPVLSIREKISSVMNNLAARTVGVHIRRTDNANAIKFSPIDLFISRMNQELLAEPGTTFFLCTDDPAAEGEVITVFGELIKTYNKELSRVTIKGAEDALVDLFCLAGTRKIIGSYWSSFSEVASRIKNIELEVLKQEQNQCR